MRCRCNPLAIARRYWLFPLAVVLTLLTQAGPRGADSTPSTFGSPLCGEFAIAKDGRMLVLPVNVGDRVLPCLLDTGARFSGFDASLREILGEPIGQRVLTTPAGRSRVLTYPWPDATLGGQALGTQQPVVCVDLDDVRRATDENILGVIGMDVLRQCRLQIDFDRGVLSFLESLPENSDELGERLPLRFVDDAVPAIFGHLADDVVEPFAIDTGAHGNSLAAEWFDEFWERNEIRLGSASISATVGGDVRTQRGRLRRFAVGPFTHDDLRFSRLPLSSLGTRYLSRFRVTFDFPGACVYLRSGAQFDKPEPRATSGLVLSWRDGETIIDSVKADGPGRRAGLKAGDALLRIDGKVADAFDPFTLRQLLTSQQGRCVPLTVRRGTRELDVEIVLDEG
ncbi:MAG TPA: PDZ domain-containing protein [Pirellulales bacterium]|nr:PDZ domain-containing protein [Pirellulales bacterium]